VKWLSPRSFREPMGKADLLVGGGNPVSAFHMQPIKIATSFNRPGKTHPITTRSGCMARKAGQWGRRVGVWNGRWSHTHLEGALCAVPEVKGFAFGVLVDEKHETKRDGIE